MKAHVVDGGMGKQLQAAEVITSRDKQPRTGWRWVFVLNKRTLALGGTCEKYSSISFGHGDKYLTEVREQNVKNVSRMWTVRSNKLYSSLLDLGVSIIRKISQLNRKKIPTFPQHKVTKMQTS